MEGRAEFSKLGSFVFRVLREKKREEKLLRAEK